MTIVFDLDHTLFDTALLKNDIFNIFEENGASPELVLKTYETYLKDVSGSYNFDAHSKILKKNCHTFNEKKARKNFLKLQKDDFFKYVGRETLKTLDLLRKKGYRLVLLSKGSQQFQIEKIRRSGLEVFFDKITICQGDKSNVIDDLNLKRGDFFINDHFGETKMIKEKYPDLRYFLLKRVDLEKFYTLSEIDIPIILSIKELLTMA